MKFGIAIGKTTSAQTPLALAGDFEKQMIEAALCGYQTVELHCPSANDLDVDVLRRCCDRYELQISTLGTGKIYSTFGLHLLDFSEDHRNRLLTMLKAYIDKAALLGSKVTIGSVKGNAQPEQSNAIEVLAEGMRTLGKYAAERGVKLLLEATNRFENNVINTAAEARAFIERYELPSTEILLDTFHINIEESDFRCAVADAGPYLGHIHFADNQRRYPGSGCFRFPEFIRTIYAAKYDGVLSVECLPLPDGKTAAEKAIQFFRSYV